MTKVTILGQEEPKKELKKIEFIKHLKHDLGLSDQCQQPLSWDYVVLLAKNYHSSGFDLMYAYDEHHINDDHKNCLYLGHFNDGIV